MRLVIKGAYYFDGDTILVPHYTGEFFIVDCDQYITKEELKDQYSESYIENVKDNYIEYDGIKYYYAEYSPFGVENWELLSDLSELSHNEMDYDF